MMMYDEYLNIREITRLQGYQLQLSYFVHERIQLGFLPIMNAYIYMLSYM